MEQPQLTEAVKEEEKRSNRKTRNQSASHNLKDGNDFPSFRF
jgi:hypothetical protein